MKGFIVFVFTVWSVAMNAQNVNADYQTYRKGLLDDFKNYRKGILDDYADYLSGIWEEYQTFRGEKRDDTPKPYIVPDVENEPANSTPQTLPVPNVMPNEIPKEPKPTSPTKPTEPIKLTEIPTVEISFYGVNLKSVGMKTYHVSFIDPSAISDVWKKYQMDENKEVIRSLTSISMNYGLNDWFKFELARRYSDTILKNGTSSDRIVLQHFILANLGFDVRLARTQKQLLLLIPFKQKVYERSFLNIDGQKYYVFYDNISPITESSAAIYTCNLPKNVDYGNVCDLVFKQYTLALTSGRYVDRILTDGHIRVNGTVNSGMMEMLRHYPQMDVACYAASKILPPFHKDILEQIKPQLSGMNQKQAANALLHFVQYAFEYATDGDQHGYEKAYFIEENFYYPKNDCEDRAIFYAFLVHNLLGLDVHLIQYPGHECTAVNFTDKSITGDGYTYNNKVYIICDPTYIGSYIGQCMPAYTNTTPIIEQWY